MNARRRIEPDRWRQIEPLFDAALELPPHHRDPFLRRACSDDQHLLEDVTALLLDAEHPLRAMERPAALAFVGLFEPRVPPLLAGRYELTSEVARGGMGTVYLATDRLHDRQVAVKIFDATVARCVGIERFRREIHTVARLSHPHVLPLHDSGDVTTDDGDLLLFHVSPFASGGSLRQRLARNVRIAPSEVARIGREIAGALNYAHRNEVVHLDIKPENILLQDGHAILADFGIAQSYRGAAEQTTSLFGTPGYMSPEQRRREPDVDGRSDIYSLGCVLHELAVGTLPNARTHVGGRVTPRSWMNAVEQARSLRWLMPAIRRATAELKTERFANAAEFGLALETAERRERCNSSL